MASNHIQIVGGPSRETLFDALRLFKDRRFVSFDVLAEDMHRTGLTLSLVRVESIGVEDGSGDNWIVGVRDSRGEHHSLYFNTDRRTGAVLKSKFL